MSENSQLVMRLVHCQDEDDSILFLNKLLTHGKADRKLQALTCFSETTCTGTLLPQLLVSPTELTHISISAVSTATLSCLCAFSGLVSCQLYQPSEDLVNLQSLAALPKLENLTLEGGCFHCLSLGYHLTGLQIDQASVSWAPGSTDFLGLQSLSVGSFARIVLPGTGLGKCLALTKLELQTCSLTRSSLVLAGGSHGRYFNADPFPDSLANLVSLTDLTVSVQHNIVYLQEFSSFPAVTCLHLLHAYTYSLVGDPIALGRLQATVATATPYDERTTLILTGDSWWNCKPRISGPTIFVESVLHVAELPKLEQFHLRLFVLGSLLTARYIKTLSTAIATQRPKIDVVIQHGNFDFLDDNDFLQLLLGNEASN